MKPIADPTTQHPQAAPLPASGEPEEKCLPEAIALREIPLTPEAAEEIRRRLDDPSQPEHAGREMATADADILLKKVR